MNPLTLGFVASLLAGLGTGVGALPVLLPINPTERLQGILLGIGGGIMLAATSFSLILPGTEAAVEAGKFTCRCRPDYGGGGSPGGRISLGGPQYLPPRALL